MLNAATIQARQTLQHAAKHADLFIVACGWCDAVKSVEAGSGKTPGVSHGICPTCVASLKHEEVA